jgi:hypothetical protein
LILQNPLSLFFFPYLGWYSQNYLILFSLTPSLKCFQKDKAYYARN